MSTDCKVNVLLCTFPPLPSIFDEVSKVNIRALLLSDESGIFWGIEKVTIIERSYVGFSPITLLRGISKQRVGLEIGLFKNLKG
jgi:hypothetical protein